MSWDYDLTARKLLAYFERQLVANEDVVDEWVNGKAATDEWLRLLESGHRPSGPELDALDRLLAREDHGGTGWVELRLASAAWREDILKRL